MRGVRNADQFLIEFRNARRNYEQRFRPTIERAFVSLAADLGRGDDIPTKYVDDQLEAHIRTYFVDFLLKALNWRLDNNLVPEAAVSSASRGTRRFLDYLGIESNTDRPLLVVETKRPNSPPPVIKLNIRHDTDFSSVICAGLGGTELIGEWNDWLNTLRDYVRSIQHRMNHVPERVILTNGDWLILFTDPVDAFLSDDGPTPEKILSWQNRDDLERNYVEIFRWLDYYAILQETPSLTIIDLPFFINKNAVDEVMYGLRLNYIEVRSMFRPSPRIEVLPILFIGSRVGAWLHVEDGNEKLLCEIPHDYTKLSEHLAQVDSVAKSLLEKLNLILEIDFAPSPLLAHYNKEEEEFSDLPGVTEIQNSEGATEFLIVTGDKPHFLLPVPTVPECPHHDGLQSQDLGVGCNPEPIRKRSVHDPRAFFISLESHHCAHREVAIAKNCQITKENITRCGNRSGKDGQAFCEIVSFEEYLCCRTCVFEEVCTKAEVFHLPCTREEDT